MKWLKLSIIIILIIILIITTVLLVMMRMNNNQIDADPLYEHMAEGKKIKPTLVETKTYFSIDECVNKIVSCVMENNNEKLYSLLNKEYAEKELITQDNLLKKIGLNTIKKYKTTKIYRASRRRIRYVLH